MKRIQKAVDDFVNSTGYNPVGKLLRWIFSYPKGYYALWDPTGVRHGCVMNMRYQSMGQITEDRWVYYPRVKWRAKELPKPIPLPGFGKDRVSDSLWIDHLERHT